jgi:hypothetical protein
VRREALYNILIKFGIPIKLVRLIKMYLNETYTKARIVRYLSDSFPIQNGLQQVDALSPLLFNFGLGHAIRKVQENQAYLKVNRTHQLLAYGDDVNLLVHNIYTIKTTLINASKEANLEINVKKLNICCYLVTRI